VAIFMRRALLISFLALSACGGGVTLPSRSVSAQQALTGMAEALEFESPQVRQDLFRSIVKTSEGQAGLVPSGPVYFPMARGQELIAAPALDPRIDLLSGSDAGHPVQLVMDNREESWAEDRRDSFQGLSEREAAELVARSLIAQWGLEFTAPIQVVRTSGTPYAAAWVDGTLRVNPAFVVMAAAPSN
jgi:hypothetical protein